MKKLLALLLAGVMLVGMAACGGEGSDEDSDKVSEDKVSSIKDNNVKKENNTFLEYGAFEDVGNDPNNLWMSYCAPAFDDNYIYYTYYAKNSSSIYRMAYDGTENTKLSFKSDGDIEHLNVYDGYLYLGNSYGGGNAYAKLVRINTDTLESEVVYEQVGSWSEGYEINAVYAAHGYVFFVVSGGEYKNKTTEIMALDPKTLECYGLISIEGERDAKFTSDNEGNIYAFVETAGSGSNERNILKMNVDEINRLGEEATMLEVVSEKRLNVYASHTFAPNGYCSFSENYLSYYYADIDLDDRSLSVGEDDIPNIAEDSEYASLYSSKNQRFAIDGNLVILDTRYKTATTIWYCKDMDVNNPVEITKVEGGTEGLNPFQNSKENLFGVHNDKVYIIETTDDANTLITINTDGTVTKNTVQ